MNRQTASLPNTVEDPLYPSSDGRPMGDTDFHSFAQILLRQALEDFFAEQDVYVAFNLIMYWEEGNRSARRDPDVLVARGVGTHFRRTFKLWEEAHLPCTVFEIASKKTWRVDVGAKVQEYQDVGIREYFIFDPEGGYVDPQLQGFRLVKKRYRPITPAADGSLVSKQLGLRLVQEAGMLRLIDAATGEPIPTRSEKAEALAAEVARLRAELDSLNGE